MEISLREWLVVGGVIIIVLIIFDGWRRVRGSRNSLRMDIDRKLRDLPEEPAAPSSNPELPYGGARPISGEVPEFVPKRKQSSAYAAKMAAMAQAADESAAEPVERIEPTFGFDDDAKVESSPSHPHQSPVSDPAPVAPARTTNPVAATQSGATPAAAASPAPVARPPEPLQGFAPDSEADPLFDEPSDEDYPVPPQAPRANQPQGTEALANPDSAADAVPHREAEDRPAAAAFGDTDPLFDELPAQPALDLEKPIPLLMERNRQPRRAAAAPEKSQAESAPASLRAKPVTPPQQDLLFGGAPEALDDAAASDAAPAKARQSGAAPKPENVLVITAVSTMDAGFSGGLLYRLLAACDLHFGDMAIFHRHEDGSDTGPVQFSMANAVNPGTFDLTTIDQMRTPAVTFFMSMEEPRDVMNAFECMLATAETLAEHLDGDLLDENRSVLRPQTKEHYRQRIRDFEMHNRSRRGGTR
uniref:cell division protein ZipA n=1 Tax=Marinobacterium profundum TaxID=1714300 RepID=UPI00083603F5|nr:cell division protein ZipA [Marinobacterium profundum]